MAPGLGPFQDEARQSALQRGTQEARSRRVEVGFDPGTLNVEGLLHRAGGDQHKGRLQLLEHRDVRVPIVIGVQANDACAPARVRAGFGGVFHELAGDMPRHVRKGQPGHGAGVGDRFGEGWYVGDLSHGALMEGQGGKVGLGDSLSGRPRPVGLDTLKLRVDVSPKAGDDFRDALPALGHRHRKGGVLTQGHQLTLHV